MTNVFVYITTVKTDGHVISQLTFDSEYNLTLLFRYSFFAVIRVTHNDGRIIIKRLNVVYDFCPKDLPADTTGKGQLSAGPRGPLQEADDKLYAVSANQRKQQLGLQERGPGVPGVSHGPQLDGTRGVGQTWLH